jgi:hypothetical protein
MLQNCAGSSSLAEKSRKERHSRNKHFPIFLIFYIYGNGEWTDIPRGNIMGSSALNLKITSPTTLQKVSETGKR